MPAFLFVTLVTYALSSLAQHVFVITLNFHTKSRRCESRRLWTKLCDLGNISKLPPATEMVEGLLWWEEVWNPGKDCGLVVSSAGRP